MYIIKLDWQFCNLFIICCSDFSPTLLALMIMVRPHLFKFHSNIFAIKISHRPIYKWTKLQTFRNIFLSTVIFVLLWFSTKKPNQMNKNKNWCRYMVAKFLWRKKRQDQMQHENKMLCFFLYQPFESESEWWFFLLFYIPIVITCVKSTDRYIVR
jgi:hypothetical protein